MRDMAVLAPGIFAWGLVTGVAMAGSGMGMTLALAMSLLVFSGSAQLATMPLIVAGAPVWVVWLTALCVNLRFVVFSVTWARYLRLLPLAQRLRLSYFAADMNFVLFLRRYPEPVPAPGQVAYLWGTVPLNWGAWQLGSLLGIFGAHLVPAHWVSDSPARSRCWASCARCSGRARPGWQRPSPGRRRWPPSRCR